MKKIESKTLVDKGFDSDYTSARIEEFNSLFASAKQVQEYVYRMHEQDNTLDLKRGEFYPEILRCIVSFKRAISSAYDIDAEQCQPNFGSNGSIDTILTAMKLREINKKINSQNEGGMLVATPTYFRNYNSSYAKQIKLIKVPLTKEWNFDLSAFIKIISESKPTVIFLVTPNNPTGIPISDSHIIKVIESASDNTLVVIDRTLVNVSSEISSKELIKKFKYKQLAILHSFSKYLGLSHLRVGFAIYSNLEIAREIAPHLPLGLGVEGTVRATKYLQENGEAKASPDIVANIVKNKKILSDFCSVNKRFSCTDFYGNYCLLILSKNLTAQQVVGDLEKEGIYTMGGLDFPEPIEGVVRIHTGGKPEFIHRLVNKLELLYPSNVNETVL